MLFSAALPAVFFLFSTKPWVVAANGRDQQPSQPSNDTVDDDIDNFSNIRYTAALTINGKILNVILDTGSTDLWLNPYDGVGSFESTGVMKKLAYGQGDSFINGTVGLVEMSIAGHTIPRQAFINVTKIVGLDACASGICGLVGLGFDSPTAGIEKVLTDAGLDGPALGKSVLSSIFDQDPEKGRFFAFSLSRLGDDKDTADASLSIAEYDEKYAEVQWMAKRPVFPATAKSWHILSDGATVNGASVPWSANDAGTPSGQLLIGLDTGTTNIIVRPEVRDSIYSAVPGAVLAKNSSLKNTHWSADHDVWVVPCNTPVGFSAVFGGQPYPMHPLDITEMRTQKGPDGVTYTYCVGAVTNGGTITSGKTDALYGDSFLRNVYTVSCPRPTSGSRHRILRMFVSSSSQRTRQKSPPRISFASLMVSRSQGVRVRLLVLPVGRARARAPRKV
ncbi:aspartic peptidase domain-containing protein [Mycena alexandri]|uniref:Aspartic peptidase domain-containing protein n=1 Tax=Mycena alexandri TaxID=1745969 RepID=A0AAD6T558_9AGAR|nr:aspartic peptidase domain-containing protein [Mycena alexandri]